MAAMARSSMRSSAMSRCRVMSRCVAALRPTVTSNSSGNIQKRQLVTVPRSADPGSEPASTSVDKLEDQSESAQKASNAERLRAAEKFMVVGAGNATCNGCGYEYKPEVGDPEFPVPRGTKFESLPSDYVCPICGAGKDKFQSRVKVVAGFAENQKYGLGANSMTGDQKLILIYGALALFFVLFLAGYGLS